MKVFIGLALTLIGTKVSIAADLVCTTGEAYIVLALDGSRSGTSLKITFQSQFAADVAAALKVRPDRFGIVFYSSTSDKPDATFGLKGARKMMLFNSRPTVTKVVIIFTARQSPQPVETKKETVRLKEMNAKILAIAVGNAAQSEVLDIASQPDYAFKVDSFEVIQTLKDDVIKKICQATGGHTHRVCPNGSHLVGTQCLTSSSQKMTQPDAAKSCAANNGGKIFEVRTEALYKQLGDIAKAKGVKLWAGAEETAEGEWRWLSDNSSATIPKKWFARGEPNNWEGNEECLMMTPRRKLNDAECGKRFNFVCVN